MKKLTLTKPDHNKRDAFIHESGLRTPVERFQRSTVNRSWLLMQLQSMQARSEREKKCGAVLSLSIERRFQHDDMALLSWGIDQHLVRCASGYTVVAVGNLEFVVLLENLDTHYTSAAVEANRVAQRILVEFGQPLCLPELELACSPSIGIFVFDQVPMPASTLLGNARFAMYQAIAAGENTIRFYDPALEEILDLHDELKAGLDSGQFVLEIEPSPENGDETAGREVLLKWRHSQYGTLAHGELLELAQRAGMGHVLTLWALSQACTKLLCWSRNTLTAHLSITVEVAARAFERFDFIDELMVLVEKAEVQSDRLKLRLNEKIVASDAVIEKINYLKARGIDVLLGCRRQFPC